ALVGTGQLEVYFHNDLLRSKDATFRAWGVRAAGTMGTVPVLVRERVQQLANDPSPDVKLQVAIAARRIQGVEALPLLVQVLHHSGEDLLIPHIVWQNLHPLLESQSAAFLRIVEAKNILREPSVARLMP